MFTLLSAMHAATERINTTPQVGDIVSFAGSADEPDAGGVRLFGLRLGQPVCDLDLSTLRRSGGSLVVENQIAGTPGSFLVHWAGEHTAAGAGDCGASTNLILTTRDLDTLALSAGGYGAGKKSLPAAVPEFAK